MKVSEDEPYSLERAVAINTWYKLLTGWPITASGTPYHEADVPTQKKYWGNFLNIAITRLGDGREA